MTDKKSIELIEAQLQELPTISDEDKHDPVKINWAIYERLGIMDNNNKTAIKIGNIAYQKADTAYNTACEIKAQFDGIKGDVKKVSKFFAWVSSVLVGIAVIWQSIKEIWHLK